ncbi:unnamed protein product [Rotaria sordida]|uniref:Uncharacterized protein n=1 Tax=Rotaria sordida TaxID=392033 RepID=A0A814D5A3_9BILA|nr:unnamed protein product [Rotaria sordida]CAF0990678.1 unnamed protein product [Rotaria sordida]
MWNQVLNINGFASNAAQEQAVESFDPQENDIKSNIEYKQECVCSSDDHGEQSKVSYDGEDQFCFSTLELNLRNALSTEEIVALGEIGSDLISSGHPSIVIQKEALINQLKLAKEMNLSVMITSRNSFIDTINSSLKVLDSDYLINWRRFGYGSIELAMLK